MNILVTGANGFIGKNLCAALLNRKDLQVFKFDLGNTPGELREWLGRAEVVFHLAGVNRPREEGEFHSGNAGFTAELCRLLKEQKRAPKIVFTSSIQAELDNPYGVSKREAEEVLRQFADASGAECVVFRLKNIFGKWCRPNYNAVTATFCHNAAHDLPLEISDPGRMMELTYIDDVVTAFVKEMEKSTPGFRFGEPLPSHRISLGELAGLIGSFREQRRSLLLPNFAEPFVRALYATYLSYLEPAELGYDLETQSDPRGELAEILKSAHFGQIFVSKTKPGITRGNHYHHSKVEKFLVVQGEALIRFRNILETGVHETRVSGGQWQVVDIPPGMTHSITNIGSEDLVTLFWADEVLNKEKPDTYPAAVQEEEK